MERRAPLKRRAMPRRTSALSRTHKRETAAETEARHAFNAAVWAKGPCIRFPHCVCSETTACDAHHVCPKSKLKAHFSHLPEDELLAIVFDPDDGVPACPYLHANLTTANDRLTAADLERFPEVYAFATELGIEHLLERELAPK